MKKILWTRKPEKTPANVDPATSARNSTVAGRVRGPEDGHPGECDETGLGGLEDDAEDEVAGRDLGDGIQELLDPAQQIDAERLAGEAEESEAADPRGDAEQPLPDARPDDPPPLGRGQLKIPSSTTPPITAATPSHWIGAGRSCRKSTPPTIGMTAYGADAALTIDVSACSAPTLNMT